MTAVCPFMAAPLANSFPIPSGSHKFRIDEKDGAQAEFLNPPPMQSGVRYTLRLGRTVRSLTDQLAECPLTRNLLKRVTDAAGGKAPRIQCDADESSFRFEENRLQLRSGLERCPMLTVLIQELSNAARRAEHEEVTAAAQAGDLNREDYVERIEMIEFPGVRLRVRASEACGPVWKCPQVDLVDWQKETDFVRYYDGLKRNVPKHPAEYGVWWDRNYRVHYEKKHGGSGS